MLLQLGTWLLRLLCRMVFTLQECPDPPENQHRRNHGDQGDDEWGLLTLRVGLDRHSYTTRRCGGKLPATVAEFCRP
jgi:hypothetical protein